MAYKSTTVRTKKGKATKKTVSKPKKRKTPKKTKDTLRIVVMKKK